MVDTDLMMEKLLRGAFVGVGAFSSSYVGEQINKVSEDIGENTLSVAKIGLGAGASVVAADDDLLLDLGASNDSMQSEAVEFIGYGLQGAGYSALGDSLDLGLEDGNNNSSGRGTSKSARTLTRSRATTDGGASRSQRNNRSSNQEENLLIDA